MAGEVEKTRRGGAAIRLWRSGTPRALNTFSRLAPRPHARNAERLRTTYPGMAPDEIAESLVADASRVSAAVGAVAGFCALAPLPLGAPIAAFGHSTAASALRVRLTAELHEVYGLPNPSPVNAGTTGYVAQWAARDEQQPDLVVRTVPAVAWAVVRTLPRSIRKRLTSPRTLLASTAVAAGLRSGRRTRKYGESLRRDLRKDPSARLDWTD
ncbi:hypothetical protein KDK95_16915 [Actinospica sp. MGRD01-02]|uniref:Uncharacterized protein n=1 Tax=Actinospica acidithermotolerans TaxID=2828514 RepID=A0A941IH07_9ACTN|nr:hypothetical protein [Actinospica acidithermotolerans]MBR7828000.1 hypothetical protein [Actinospica acidithermotolerans]